MSIRKHDGCYILNCCVCNNATVAVMDYDAAMWHKRENGWRARRVDGEWWDVCPDCAAIEAERLHARCERQRVAGGGLLSMEGMGS